MVDCQGCEESTRPCPVSPSRQRRALPNKCHRELKDSS
jgi:hypothetical protein